MTMPLGNSVVNNSVDRGTFEDFYDGKAIQKRGRVGEQVTAAHFSRGNPSAKRLKRKAQPPS